MHVTRTCTSVGKELSSKEKDTALLTGTGALNRKYLPVLGREKHIAIPQQCKQSLRSITLLPSCLPAAPPNLHAGTTVPRRSILEHITDSLRIRQSDCAHWKLNSPHTRDVSAGVCLSIQPPPREPGQASRPPAQHHSYAASCSSVRDLPPRPIPSPSSDPPLPPPRQCEGPIRPSPPARPAPATARPSSVR